MNTDIVYYAAQIKPSYYPSEYIFTIAWSAIYPLMAVATSVSYIFDL